MERGEEMIDTAGNKQEVVTSCQCGLTGGCLLCNPRLFDPSYGHEQLQKGIDDNAKNALPIEKFKEVREKTKEIVDWKQYLTEEILKKCWHDVDESGDVYYCKKCRKSRAEIFISETKRVTDNRTFDNRNDMMDLYEEIKKAGKWKVFTIYSNNIRREEGVELYYNDVEQAMAYYNDWLFCLGKEDYEAKCKLVAEFYGYKEGKMVLERLKGRKHPEDHPDVELMCENDNIPGDFDGVIKIAGLEKIEPLTTSNIGYSISGVDHVTGVSPPSNHELMRVINQIIEQQNRIADYLNRETHGCPTKYCHHA